MPLEECVEVAGRPFVEFDRDACPPQPCRAPPRPPPARPAWEAPPWPPCQAPRAECPPPPRDELLEWEERRAVGAAGFGVILSTVDEERETPSKRSTQAAGRLTSYLPRGTTCETGTPPSPPSWYDARIGEQGQQRFYFHPVGIGFHRFLFFWGYTSESSHFSQPRA